MSHEFDFKAKETSCTIPKNFNLYKMCHLKRHFPQFHKFQYILKVSLKETPSTIQKNWIYIKGVSWKDTFHNSTKSNMY